MTSRTIVSVFEENARKFSDRPFLRWRDAALNEHLLTLGEFAGHVNRTGNVLKSAGVRKGERLGIILPNRPETVFFFAAGLKIGAVANPTNPKIRGEGLSFILNNSEERVVATDREHIGVIAALESELPHLETIISVDGTPGETVALKSGRRVKALDYQRLFPEAAPELPPERLDEKDGCSLIYSSGTTGKNPKGALVNHGNYLWDVEAMIEAGELTNEDAGYCFLPLFHVFGLVSAVSTPIVTGGSTRVTDFMTEILVHKLLFKTIEKDRVTSFGAVPTMLKFITDSYDPPSEDISSLRFIFSGGGPLPYDVYREFKKKFGVEVLQGWGQSEGVCGYTVNPVKGPNKPHSIGKPFPGIELAIMPYVSEDGSHVRLHKNEQGYYTGEIVAVRAPVMDGYINNPEGTKEVFDEEGRLRTGDIGYMDEDGYFYIVDRKKDMVVRGGENHYTGPIEDGIIESGLAYMAAVYGLENPTYGQIIAASVVPMPGADKKTLAERIREYCKNNGLFPPDLVIVESSLPINDVGKVLKRQLRQAHLAKGVEFAPKE
ncbi:MAG: class I adenylate-forming enzyme family protein [bacterium]